ncbi:Cell division cycle protein 123-like protein [Trichoplax sp. H2]|nr:Cell division cycle protein 123-like protein [Trichoplax sp. H2]|eukprot:RDD45991.1 Cell division cycle protein 123-like protein [Trichoplax sp. H2]
METSTQHVLNCSFSSWYPKFRRLTITSRVVPLPIEFINYLNADGVVLPQACPQPSTRYTCGDESDSDLSDEWNNASDDEDTTAPIPTFPKLEEDVNQHIRELGGYVFPKLNWSSPQDAAWISHNGTLQCSTFQDITLLLKSSDRVGHDLTKPHLSFEGCQDPAGDFSGYEACKIYEQYRKECKDFDTKPINFVHAAISQRDISNYYPFMVTTMTECCHDIAKFFYKNIKEKFTETNYVIDIYRRKKNSITLVDFNPFNTLTDTALFEWSELTSGQPLAGHRVKCPIDDQESRIQIVIFRCIEGSHGIASNPYLRSKVPLDIAEANSNVNASQLVEYLKLMSKKMENDDI